MHPGNAEREGVSTAEARQPSDAKNTRQNLEPFRSIGWGPHRIWRYVSSNRSIADPWNRRGSWMDIGFRSDICLRGGMKLVAEFVFRFLEFANRLSHTPRQLGQLLRAEEHKYDKKNEDEFLTTHIHEGKKHHKIAAKIRLSLRVARQFA